LDVAHKKLCDTCIRVPSPNTRPCAELAHELGRHARLLQVMRSRLGGLVPDGLDGAAIAVLASLVKCGPRRQGELAEATMLDPSTVSRYVAQLVRAGLVDRRADPADGRAVQLVATENGQALGARIAAHRELLIGQMLAGWSEEDAHTLLRLVRRLNEEMEARRDSHEPARPPTDAARPATH
jgi:DNA-binding MarR family transcriptional regulator